MATSLQLIQIQPKILGGRVVIPAFELGAQIEFPQQDGRYLTVVEHQARGVPTLGQLRHAFETSPAFKRSVVSQKDSGEWTGTTYEDGKYVHEGARLVRDGDTWEAEGGTRTKARMPEDGWVKEYHPTLGVPTKTGDKEDAVAKFGKDASYFLGSKEGFRPVVRDHNLYGGGPFYVGAGWVPFDRYSFVGGRSCRRSEQVAQQPATPRVLDEDAVAEFNRYRTQVDEGLKGIDDVFSRFGIK